MQTCIVTHVQQGSEQPHWYMVLPRVVDWMLEMGVFQVEAVV